MLIQLALLASLAAPQTPAPQEAPATLDRVVVIGASMSAGFGLSTELDAKVDLGDVLQLALGERDGKLTSLGDTMLFTDPLGIGQAQVTKAVAEKPTLVIALDFQFWFGYGWGSTCEARLKHLEVGLARLARFDCPLLVGDFPDMTRALKGSSPITGGNPMLQPEQIPDAACRAQLNQRLKEWAAKRSNVRIWPMSKFVAEIARDSTLVVRGNSYDAARKRTLLQADFLHPTSQGVVAVTIQALDSLVSAGWIEDKHIQWDARALHAALMESTRAAREKKQASRKRKEERRKKREQEAKEKAGDDGGEQRAA